MNLVKPNCTARTFHWIAGVVIASTVAGCGGGGGGGGGSSSGGGSSTKVVEYPYSKYFASGQFVQCAQYSPSPGCTFDTKTGQKITVSRDPGYYRSTDDLKVAYVDKDGVIEITDYKGNFLGYTTVDYIQGYVKGSWASISDGLHTTNIADQTFYLGQNGILYVADFFANNFGSAVNKYGSAARRSHGKATSAAGTESREESLYQQFAAQQASTIDSLAGHFEKDFGIPAEKAHLISGALATYHGFLRGPGAADAVILAATGEKLDGFNGVAKSYLSGEKVAAAAQARELQERIAGNLGVGPGAARAFLLNVMSEVSQDYPEAYAFAAEVTAAH